MLDAFESLCTATSAEWERRGDGALMRYAKAPVPAFNGVIVRGEGFAEELESLVRPHDGVTAVDAPATVEEARRLGLIETVEMPGMVATREEFAPAPVEGEVADDDVATALDLLTASFGSPREWFDELYTPEVLERAGANAYVLRVGGRPVATAVSVRTTDALGIFNVGTPAAERGRGYGGAITSHAVERGFAEGAAFAYLQSSEFGYSVYERLGFEHVCTYTLSFAPPH